MNGLSKQPAFPSLRNLDLSGSSVTDKAIVQMLFHCPALQTLELRSCAFVGEQNAAAYANLADLGELKHLDLSDCKKVTNEVRYQLNVLSLATGNSYNMFSLFQVVMAILSRCGALRTLSLALCPGVSSPVLAYIATHCPQIENLDLSGCKVEDDALISLFKTCTSIRSIKINACKNVCKLLSLYLSNQLLLRVS